MFENFNESAKRVVFFARYEAVQLATESIGTEHFLLGLVREARGPAFRVLAAHRISVEEIRKSLKRRPRSGKVDRDVDATFSKDAEKVLAGAAREARDLGQAQVSSEHILLALLRDTGSHGGSLLHGLGLQVDEVRAEVAELSNDPTVWQWEPLEKLLREYDRDASMRAKLADSEQNEVEELRERLRIVALGLDAAIDRQDFAGASLRHEEHMAAELRLRQLLDPISK